MKHLLLFLSILFISNLSGAPLEVKQEIPVEKNFIIDPNHEGNRIEFLFSKPQGDGPFPVIFLIHGSQPKGRMIGGQQLVDLDYLGHFIKEGIVAVSISMPGYGNSDGVLDFAGPNSQKAVAAVISHFSQIPFVDPARMGIYGISKGAILASMIHSHYPTLAIQILEAGSYDFLSRRHQLPSYLDGIQQNMLREAGDSEEGLKNRSACYHTHPIQAKTLILHGGLDDRKGLSSAQTLHEKLLIERKSSVLKVFPNSTHVLPPVKWETIFPFVREHLLDLFGIGIKITQSNPAIQIIEIYPGFPADRSGKLRLGDAILRISPQNDHHEIEALEMTLQKLTTLLLGKKGTGIRLYV